MQRDRNRNSAGNVDYQNIVVTGFIGDKKGTPAKKDKSGKGKQKAAQKDLVETKNAFNNAFRRAIREFEKDALAKILQTENKILELKAKIAATSNESGQIYQDHIDKLEYSKKILYTKHDQYQEIGAENWDLFKDNFNDELSNLEISVTHFVQYLESRKNTEDNSIVK